MDDEDLELGKDSVPYCSECLFLTEALRELEAECREAEDELRIPCVGTDKEQRQREQERRLARIEKLERRRNFALDMLFKHQELEHLR